MHLIREYVLVAVSLIFRRSHVERDRDGAGRASREEGGQTARCSGASHTQPRAGASGYQARQHTRISQRFLAYQAMRLRRDQTGQHRRAKAQRVAAVLAARGIADRH